MTTQTTERKPRSYDNAAELRDATDRRDAQRMTPGLAGTEGYTDVKAYVTALEADAAAGLVEHGRVLIARQTSIALVREVVDRAIGGDTRNPLYRSVYVSSSYDARGKQVTLSAYCGAMLAKDAPTPPAHRIGIEVQRQTATAQRAQETETLLSKALSGIKGLTVIGGGALHMHALDETWRALPGESIDAPSEQTCATCGVGVYWANKAWRSRETRRAEELTDGENAHGQPMRVLHHLHDPEQVGRRV